MPIFSYRCECGHYLKKFFRNPSLAPLTLSCNSCNVKQAKKQLSVSSNSTKVIVDNGFMSRQVEVDPEIIKINEERANKDYREE